MDSTFLLWVDSHQLMYKQQSPSPKQRDWSPAPSSSQAQELKIQSHLNCVKWREHQIQTWTGDTKVSETTIKCVAIDFCFWKGTNQLDIPYLDREKSTSHIVHNLNTRLKCLFIILINMDLPAQHSSHSDDKTYWYDSNVKERRILIQHH